MSCSGPVDISVENYELNLTNKTTEDALDDESHSCAGNFEVLLQPHLDLTPLMYLKAVENEIVLDSIQVGGMPLTFSRLEQCHIVITLPTYIAASNKYINEWKLKQQNRDAMVLPLADISCRDTKEVVDFLNDAFRCRVNYFLLCQYLRVFFDDEILKPHSSQPFTSNDLKVLIRMVDVALYSRKVFHDELCRLTGHVDDISDVVTFSGKKDLVDKKTEQSIVEESECLHPFNERQGSSRAKTVHFDLFYGIDVTKPSTERNAVDITIKNGAIFWLKRLGFSVDEITSIDADSLQDLQRYRASNRDLIDIGLFARRILYTEKDRIDRRVKRSLLFHEDFCVLSLDVGRQRAIFNLHPKQFLHSHANITIYFPEKASYALGADIGKTIVLGPINTTMRFSVTPRLTNNIISPSQTPPCNIRNAPGIVHLTTDIVSGKGVDAFLQTTPLSDHHIVYSHHLDQTTFECRSIVNTDCPSKFLKLKKNHKILDKIKFCLVDENFQPCHFSQRTYTRLAFRIRAVSLD